MSSSLVPHPETAPTFPSQCLHMRLLMQIVWYQTIQKILLSLRTNSRSPMPHERTTPFLPDPYNRTSRKDHPMKEHDCSAGYLLRGISSWMRIGILPETVTSYSSSSPTPLPHRRQRLPHRLLRILHRNPLPLQFCRRDDAIAPRRRDDARQFPDRQPLEAV